MFVGCMFTTEDRSSCVNGTSAGVNEATAAADNSCVANCTHEHTHTHTHTHAHTYTHTHTHTHAHTHCVA